LNGGGDIALRRRGTLSLKQLTLSMEMGVVREKPNREKEQVVIKQPRVVSEVS
jgi:hypothetical protein